MHTRHLHQILRRTNITVVSKRSLVVSQPRSSGALDANSCRSISFRSGQRRLSSTSISLSMASSPTSSSLVTGEGQKQQQQSHEWKINFSAGTDQLAMTAALKPLLASAGLGGRWSLVSNGEALERTFKFKTFTKTWDFMTAVSLQCKLKNHHPEWSNVYNTTYIRWTTHNPKGLSTKDVELAGICDSLARDFSEIIEETTSGGSCGLRQVADRVVTDADDCCTPGKK